jgi:hypothetical protein
MPTHWSSWQDAVTYKTKGLVVWEVGGQAWTKYGGDNRITGTQSSVTFSSIIAVRGVYRPRRQIPTLSNENLFGRDLHICAYCGNQFSANVLTNDHIIPRSKGGSHSWTNCVTSCKRCNHKKADRLLENTNMKLLYVPYVPCREEVLILHNRRILADQMQFLIDSLPTHSRLKKMVIN